MSYPLATFDIALEQTFHIDKWLDKSLETLKAVKLDDLAGHSEFCDNTTEAYSNMVFLFYEVVQLVASHWLPHINKLHQSLATIT